MQTARMDALGQSLLAMDPYNQHLAQMFGPEAAFKPEQLAGMVNNPIPPDTSMGGYTGTDPKLKAKQAEQVAALAQWKQQNEDRRNMVLNGLTPLPAGPTPIQMPRPLPAKRV